ncbi:MAG: hypothetical protein IKD89_05245 [Clostridia bacterium]|nr:hypothetical protein [Clostridia bacterium]
MLVISNIRQSVDKSDNDAIEAAVSRLGRLKSECERAVIVRKGVDARRKNVTHVYSVGIFLKGGEKAEIAAEKKVEGASLRREFELSIPKVSPKAGMKRPVVCGFGPAGMFAALVLARAGLCPVVLERGADADARTAAVEAYNRTGRLDINTNIQFGEGGAGTFSDGKLTTRIGSPVCEFVLKTFAAHGAPDEILYLAKPHIGTDILTEVVKSIRREIIALGGEVRFLCRAEKIITKSGRVAGVLTADGELGTDTLILAAGHSARDMYEHIYESGISIVSKPFSVGFRIEHLREDIDAAMYGRFAGHKNLKSAEYQLSYREGERGVYTFCMCPGGEVVAASSEEGAFVVNGMSRHARDGVNSNSAVVVSVSAGDFGDAGPLSGMYFQRRLEKNAYLTARGCAPVSTLGAYMKTGQSTFTRVNPSIRFKTRETDISALFPAHIDEFLKRGITAFEKNIRGFSAPHAAVTGIETRTSAPVRIIRDETRRSPDVSGLYPCGEGAGYAGGIMSAAVDGVNTAMCILKSLEG